MDGSKTKPVQTDASNSVSTFIHDIPPKTRNEILAFISEIRNNPDFLASRLASLHQHELAQLLAFRPPLEPDSLSVMASSKRQPNKKLAAKVPSAIERLLSFHRHDPLSTLIHTVFANSSSSDNAEGQRRLDAWATTCARLFAEAKPGADRLTRSVLDVWAGMREWRVKQNFEVFLMEALQEGQFLLEKRENASQKMDTLARKPLEYATEEFFDRCTRRLFKLLDEDPVSGGIPDGVIEIGAAILRKLGPEKRRQRHGLEQVIVNRWFFSTFLPHALTYPEVSVRSPYTLFDGTDAKLRAKELWLDIIFSQ